MSSSYPASRRSHYSLVPGHQNTTTKEPTVRPPDMRLVTALASKGANLTESLTKMNMGPSGRDTMLQHLTTRDVLMIPDLFEPSSGFVMPPDPWDKGDGSTKTIYQRLVEEIHHAGQHDASHAAGNGHHDKAFSIGEDGLFKEDAGGLFKAWHKTNAHTAGDGLADPNGRDGNGHLIVNDRDSRWQKAQDRGEAPMYTAVHQRIEQYFQMKIQGKRYNHYRDLTNWKPFHFDSAALNKDTGKGKGKGGGGGGKGGGRPHMCESQNMTVGVSFGEARQAAFEWAGAHGRESLPEHLSSPAASHGSHRNVVLSLTVPDASTYTFGRDVNLLWRHGILAEKVPSGKDAVASIDVEEGRISIIAWGWVDQYDEMDEYLQLRESSPRTAPQHGGRGGPKGARPGLDGRSHGGHNQSEQRRRSRSRSRSRSPRRDHQGGGGPHERGRGHDQREHGNERGGYERERGQHERGDRDSHRSRDRHHDERGGRGGERDRREERDRPHSSRDHGSGSGQGFERGIDAADPSEIARREARAAKFGPR